WREYKQYFEKDPALARRFQPVHVHEPTVAEAVTILRGLAPVYASSHGVYLRDDAVQAAAELSARYLAGRQLPDKAVDVLDTACARVRISLSTPPEALERLRAEQAAAQRQLEARQRDRAAGLATDGDALKQLQDRLQSLAEDESRLCDAWERQRALAGRLQAGQPLVSHEVSPRLVAEVISHWTGIPVSQLAREHSTRVARFADDLRQRIRGQEQAVQALDRVMRASAAGLSLPDAPTGVFL